MSKVLIIYHSFTGKTEKMADAIAEGVRGVEGVEVSLKKAAEAGPTDLENTDGVAFGAPNTFGGMAGALKDFFDRAWPVHEKTKGKTAVAFTCEMPDQSGALKEIEQFLGRYGLQVAAKGIAAPGDVGQDELAQCKKMGESLAKAANNKS